MLPKETCKRKKSGLKMTQGTKTLSQKDQAREKA
jgi:hypothetical protein